jgi:hypothetical protein
MSDMRWDLAIQILGRQHGEDMIRTLQRMGVELEDIKKESREVAGQMQQLYTISAKRVHRGLLAQIANSARRSKGFLKYEQTDKQGRDRADQEKALKNLQNFQKRLGAMVEKGRRAAAARQERERKELAANIIAKNLDDLNAKKQSMSAMYADHDKQKKAQEDLQKVLGRVRNKARRDQEKQQREQDAAYRAGFRKHISQLNKLENARHREDERQEKARAKSITDAALGELKRKQQAMNAAYKAHDAEQLKKAREKARVRKAGFSDAQFDLTRSQYQNRAAHVNGFIGQHDKSGEAAKIMADAQAAYAKARQAHASYVDALKRGDREAAQSYMWFRNRFITEANQIASAAERSARRQIAANHRVTNSHQNVVHAIHRLRYQLHSLVAIAGGFALAHFGMGLVHHMTEAYKQSLEFNEEIMKAKTIFESLATTNLGKPIMQLQEDAKNNKSIAAQLDMAKNFGQGMADLVREKAALTGMGMDEVAEVAKQLVPHFMNKFTGKDKGAVGLLKNSDMVQKITGDVVELAAVLKMLDPGKHRMKWQAFALEETLSGTTGEKGKGKGSDAFRSMRTRLGINATAEEKAAITQAQQKGDLQKWDELIKKLLARSGVTQYKLMDIMNRSMFTNLEAMKNTLKFIGGIFSEPSYLAMGKFFHTLNIHLVNVSKYEPFKRYVQKLGEEFANFVQLRYLDPFFRFVKWIEKTPQGKNWLAVQIENFKVMGIIADGVFKNIMSFAAGFLGIDFDGKSKSMKEIKEYGLAMQKTLNDTRGPAHELGEAFRKMADALLASGPYLNILADVLTHWQTFAGAGIGFAVGGVPGALAGGAAGYASGKLHDGANWITQPAGWLGSVVRNAMPWQMQQQITNPTTIPSLPGSRFIPNMPVPGSVMGPEVPPGFKTGSAAPVYQIGTLVVNGVKDPKDLAAKTASAADYQLGLSNMSAFFGVG